MGFVPWDPMAAMGFLDWEGVVEIGCNMWTVGRNFLNVPHPLIRMVLYSLLIVPPAGAL